MTETYKLHEDSVDWFIDKLQYFKEFEKDSLESTTMAINPDVMVFGTNEGYLFIINRPDYSTRRILIKENTFISCVELIRTVALFVIIGLSDGSLYALSIPLNHGEIIKSEIKSLHKSAITSICWTKSFERFFTGDYDGMICCTETNYITKTMVSYFVYQSTSRINQLCYDHCCLIISTDTQTFMLDFYNSKEFAFGTNEQEKFGVAIIDKMCKIEEMEIIVVRPNGKIWLSDSNGMVKKTIFIKADVAFSQEKLINLLPSGTSQSNEIYLDILNGRTRMNLGLVIPINQNEILFWSENSLVIININSGNIVASTYNIGKIKSVSICNLMNTPNCLNANQSLYEIWILRQPICENDNKLIRLSFMPLINFYKENWLNKFTVKTQHIDVVETFNEIKNKTKNDFKQGQLLLNDKDKIILEEDDKFTEDDKMINFDNSSLPVENTNLSIEVQSNIVGDHAVIRESKENLNIVNELQNLNTPIFNTSQNREFSNNMKIKNDGAENQSQGNVEINVLDEDIRQKCPFWDMTNINNVLQENINQSNEKAMKPRFSFTEEQLKILKGEYANDVKIDKQRLERLASDMGVSPKKIQTWFQNTRSREKKMTI